MEATRWRNGREKCERKEEEKTDVARKKETGYVAREKRRE